VTEEHCEGREEKAIARGAQGLMVAVHTLIYNYIHYAGRTVW